MSDTEATMDKAIWVRLRSVLDRKPEATTVTINRESAEEMLAEIKRLRAALKPIAAFCASIDATEAGRLAPASQMIHGHLTVGAFRNARAALHPAPIQKEEG